MQKCKKSTWFMLVLVLMSISFSGCGGGGKTEIKEKNMVKVEGGGSITRDFYIGKHEVTQSEFESVMGFNPSSIIDRNNPVEQVTWFDAVMYCNKLSEKEGLSLYYSISDIQYHNSGNTKNIESATVSILGGKGYRLPTETEWEYAARGGNQSQGYTYAGSNNIDEVAWYVDNSRRKTQPVGRKKVNELGIYDMSGNVWEWTSTDNESAKIIRGGSFDGINHFSLLNYRGVTFPENRKEYLGFRILKEIEL